MKSNFPFIITLVMCASPLARASYDVCAGTTVHHSIVSSDFGTQPRPGTVTRTEFLSVKGQLLGRQVTFTGGIFSGTWPFEITLTDRRNLVSEGVGTPSTFSVSQATMTVTRRIRRRVETLVSETVTCTQTRNFVP